uniref:Ninjurin a n=1 Tax=Anopheles atroparvus TaxID=41427 RepID=A0A182IL74_ANOAO
MGSNDDMNLAVVRINIESSPLDGPDAVDRAALSPPTVDTSRGRRPNGRTPTNNNGGSTNNGGGKNGGTNNARIRSNSRSPWRRKRDVDTLDTGDDFDDKDNQGIENGFLVPVANGAAGGGGEGRRGERRNEQPRFPFAPGFAPDGTRSVQTTEAGHIIPDVNVYQQKKNLAQGMMDLALLSANANQLRYVLESYKRHPYFYVNLTFITTSIIAQVAVGIGLIWKSRYNIKKEEDFIKADHVNNFVTIGIFIITIVNVLISAFGVAEPTV